MGERRLNRDLRIPDSVLDMMAEAVLVVDRSGRLVYANQAAHRLFGGDAGPPLADWKAGGGLRLADGVTPCAGNEHPLSRALRGEVVRHAKLFVARSDQDGSLVDAAGYPLPGGDGGDRGVAGAVLVLLDITERTQIETRLRKSEEALREAQRIAHVGSWEWDSRSDSVAWSLELFRIFGRDGSVGGSRLRDHASAYTPESAARLESAVADALRSGKAYELDLEVARPDGETKWVIARGEPMQDDYGAVVGLRGTIADITERKALERELEIQARQDYLTRLMNRRSFFASAELELARAQRYRGHFSLLMVDVDNFKAINDAYGHKVGDLVLARIGDVFRETLREVDIVGRIGGEEFAVLLPETARGRAMEVAERLREAMAAARIPLKHGGELAFSVSVGVTSLQDTDQSIDTLLSRADVALYDAKHAGRNRTCYRDRQ